MYTKKKPASRGKGGSSLGQMDSNGDELDIQKMLKDIEFLGSSHMSWKERKDLENRKVVSLGGKPPKKQRIPLSVARVTMKKKKEREHKMLQEGMVLGRFGGKFASSNNRVAEKRKAEDRVLKSSDGYFRKGVLDVKHLLRPTSSGDNDSSTRIGKGTKKKGSRNKGGKKKGGKRR